MRRHGSPKCGNDSAASLPLFVVSGCYPQMLNVGSLLCCAAFSFCFFSCSALRACFAAFSCCMVLVQAAGCADSVRFELFSAAKLTEVARVAIAIRRIKLVFMALLLKIYLYEAFFSLALRTHEM